jgi:hypothetical protein
VDQAKEVYVRIGSSIAASQGKSRLTVEVALGATVDRLAAGGILHLIRDQYGAEQ